MRLDRFAAAAWAVLAVNFVVVLWGAFVRASGSGAGCGSHWPRCNGQVIPQSPSAKTLVEFTHRMMTGVDGFLFWNGRSLIGWSLTAVGALFIFAGIIANLEIHFLPTSLFNTLVILTLLVGGLGLIFRSLRPMGG